MVTRIWLRQAGRRAQPVVRNLLSNRTGRCATIRVTIPLNAVPFGLPRKETYTTSEVAQILRISPDLLRWRINVGKYPKIAWKNKRERAFTLHDINRLLKNHSTRVQEEMDTCA
jgi:hypothetical protein